MVKFNDTEITFDQGVNIFNGVVSAGKGLSMMGNPAKAQDYVLESSGQRSNGMTTVAGSALLALGATNIAIGLANDVKANKLQLKVQACHNALMCGMALADIGNTDDKRVFQKDKMMTAATLAGVNAIFLAYRGLKKDNIPSNSLVATKNQVVETVKSKFG